MTVRKIMLDAVNGIKNNCKKKSNAIKSENLAPLKKFLFALRPRVYSNGFVRK